MIGDFALCGERFAAARYTEDTLLSAMEVAGAKEMPEDAERKGLGTPATRAAILEKLVESPCFTAFTVMIQREVARRLCAPQGSSEGGSFSLFLQYYMKPELLFDVPPEKFLPAPKVTSAVIRCVRRERPAVDVADEGFFFKVMRGGFLLRRKTLANSLSAALPGIPKESIQQAITDMGLPAAVRGEQLTLEDFAALSAALGREADGD